MDKYSYSFTPQKDGSFVGEVLEFYNCKAKGATPEEVLIKLQKKVARKTKQLAKRNQPIPEPYFMREKSGQICLRLNPELHRKAAIAARMDRVSLNTWLAATIAEYVGATNMLRTIEQMINKGE